MLGLTYENASITTPDNKTLHAWWILPHPDADTRALPAIVLWHGMHKSRYVFLPLVQPLVAHGYPVLLPDHRAHGDSEGAYATFGRLERSDVALWLDWLQQRTNGKVGFFGISYGGIISLRTAPHEPRITAVVAQSPYSSLDHMVRYAAAQISSALARIYHVPLRMLIKTRIGVDMREVDLIAAARQIRQPLLIVAGTEDLEVPIADSRRVAQANPAAEWLEIPGAGHNNMPKVNPELYWGTIIGFFDRTLGFAQLLKKNN